MKITIIGHAGSGKSWLARHLSEKYHIPYLHLDKVWLDAGGHLPENKSAEQKAKVKEIVSQKADDFTKQDSWVSDGWYSFDTQSLIANRADLIIYLDIPLWKRVLNHIFRSFDRINRHGELSFWDDFKFTKQLIVRTKKFQPYMDTLLQQFASKVITLKTRGEMSHYLDTDIAQSSKAK